MWSLQKKLFPIFLLVFFVALAFPAHALVSVLYDNFDDGTITDWDVNAGTWSAVSQYLDGGFEEGAGISHNVAMPASVTYFINYRILSTTAGLNGIAQWFSDQNGIKSPGDISGYQLLVQSGITRIRRVDNGSYVNLYSGAGITTGVYHDVNIIHTHDGNITFILDGVTQTTVNDTTYAMGTKFVFGTENGTQNYNFDDINIMRTEQVIPTITADYNGFGVATDTKKYVNTLNFRVNYTCFSGSGVIERFINSVNDFNYPASCVGTDQNLFGSYNHLVNGANFKIHFAVEDLLFETSAATADVNFYADINAPTADLNQSSASSGFGPSLGNVTMHFTCYDEVSPQIDYNVFRLPEQTLVFSAHSDANTTNDFNAPLNDTTTIFNGVCTDLAGNTGNDINSVTVLANCFTLVDEQSGVPLAGGDFAQFGDLVATAYSDSSTFNFLSGPSNNICFTSVGDDTIRFDINYTDGTQIYREFNLEILSNYDSNVPVCIADTQSFFEQVFTSSQQTPVVLKQQLSGCFNLADYTRYALGDALSLRAFTVIGPYFMETFDSNGQKIVLAQINGGTPSEVQLDILKFKLGEVPIQILDDFLGVSLFIPPGQTDSNTLKLYYINVAEDNLSINLKIDDNSANLFNYTDTTSPNLFVVYFDYTLLTIDGNVLKITLTKTKLDGDIETEIKYVTLQGIIQGAKGILPGGLAFLIAFVLFFFGVTLTASRFSLGWFGIFIIIICLGVLAAATQEWYVLWMEAVLIIIAAYFGILYKEENAKVS